jgi:hypothetical protein
MGERANQLHETADGQLIELIALLSARGEAVLSLPVPGREKLGDGTVGACALHTAERYQLIAEFLQDTAQMPAPRAAQGPSRHRIPRFLQARGHGPGSAAETRHEGMHDGDYTAKDVALDALLERLSATRDAFGRLAELTDERLDAVPAAGSFRFCDGHRTLEQVVAGLLKHQGHQIDAMSTALA